MSENTIKLPNGNDFWLKVDVPGSEATGLLVRFLFPPKNDPEI